MAVSIENVGVILVDEIGHAVEIVLPPRIGNAVVVPVQLVDEGHARGIVIEVGVVRIDAVAGNTGQWPGLVGAMAHGEPFVTDPQMLADAKAQTVIARRFLPQAHYVLLRPHVRRVPARVPRVPQVKVVVMHAHAEEVLCASLLVETHQTIRVPFLCFPDIDQILVTDLGRMTIRFAVVQVLRLALHVHVARVPVAVFDRRLRSPMSPDAELGIAEPVRNLVGLQRFSGGQKGAAWRHLLRAGKLRQS